MPVGPFIVAKLAADPNVTELVADGIHGVVAPQGTEPPFLTWEEFAAERYSDMGADADIADAHVRIHIWSRKLADAHILATAVRRSLARYHGNAFASLQVDDIFVHPGGATMWDEASKSFHLVRDFRVIYREA